MTCKEAREHMLEAAPEKVAGLDEHLRACTNCAQEWDAMRQTMALLDEWEAPEPSPYFDSRLRARLREAAAEPRSWLEWLRKPAIAFALAVLMVVGITIFRNAPGHQEIAKAPNSRPTTVSQTGTAIGDLQELEHDGDMYANFDVLDDLGGEAETANP
jgi:predicted anti-sigma-YlaC factor YlaD